MNVSQKQAAASSWNTGPSSAGSSIAKADTRDDYRRRLVTNCATYFNSSLVDSNTYAFDALSRPTARTTGTTGVSPVDSTFAYNNRSEVVSAAIGTNLFTHAYDDIGNHLLFGDNATTNTYTHNNLNQITSLLRASAPPRELIHNPDGDLCSDGTWSYAYDAEDQLLSVTSSSLTNGAIRVLNTYDYRRRRTSKTVQRLYSTFAPPPSPPVGVEEWHTIEARTFVYDDWNLIHETIYTIDGGTTNTTEVQYFWGLDLSDSLQGAGGVGGLLAVSRNGQFYFPTYDNNGNVTKYIDESGNIVAAYEYDDFGRIISQSGSLADFFRHRFSTKYYDPETGLYYYDYRFYSPDWRIWLNRDPDGEQFSTNLYCAFGNDPIRTIDPLGLTVLVTTDPVPTRTENIHTVRNGKNVAIRAHTRRYERFRVTCTKDCKIKVSGVFNLWIEMRPSSDAMWTIQYPQYKDNSDTDQETNALKHELDHFNTWKSFYDFVKTADQYDGKKFADCQRRIAIMMQRYNEYHELASKHSLSFHNNGMASGGRYSQHPFDTSAFKWE